MKILGVELGEKFRFVMLDGARFNDYIYRFVKTPDSIVLEYTDKGDEWHSILFDKERELVANIILLHLNAEEVPFTPFYAELYYYCDDNGEVDEGRFFKTFYDLQRYYVGNCFSTREEAEEHFNEIQKKLLDKYYNA